MPDIRIEIEEAEMAVKDAQEELRKLRAKLPPEEVQDYRLLGADGSETALSKMFGDKQDLIVVHNMGRSCPYCTLWADELNGVVHHLQNRAAFVVSSPDSPAVQADFAKSRGWRFPMYSTEGTTFAQDMGFYAETGEYAGYMPGVSTFHKDEEGRLLRTRHASFGPGDDYCSVWHFLALLKDGVDGWGPKFHY